MPHLFESHTVNRRRPSRPDPLLGSWLDDRFLIEQRIATGGFGAVYRARTRGGAAVALKVLHPALTDDPDMVARFRREGATLTRLHDPHTVTTLAVGEAEGGTLYIAMELLAGENLHARLLRERMLPWQAAAAIARAVCSSLAEAHAIGVVHRDLKPANIHVEPRDGADFVKVIDFGIVKLVQGSAADDGRELTHAGHMIGTCDYMSPEQILGTACHATSDIYSLGVVLYEMLTGRRPFPRATTPAAMLTAMLTRSPQPPAVLAAIPPALDRIVMRCLEREPRHRLSSVVELAAALDRVLERPPSTCEEITAVHPALSATLVDDRLWFSADPGAADAGEPPGAPGAWAMPAIEPPMPAIEPPGPAIEPPARAIAPAVRTPPDVLAGGTGPVQRDERDERGATPTASAFQTLPGVAVPVERRSNPGLAVTPLPTTAPALPAGSCATPWPHASIATPRLSGDLLASGTQRVRPARSLRTLWIALALIGIAAATAITAIAITLWC
jgi:serine/threonine protein kinase